MNINETSNETFKPWQKGTIAFQFKVETKRKGDEIIEPKLKFKINSREDKFKINATSFTRASSNRNSTHHLTLTPNKYNLKVGKALKGPMVSPIEIGGKCSKNRREKIFQNSSK